MKNEGWLNQPLARQNLREKKKKTTRKKRKKASAVQRKSMREKETNEVSRQRGSLWQSVGGRDKVRDVPLKET